MKMYNFKKPWSENTSIDWWRESRIELNKAIHLYNNWQIKGYCEQKAHILLATIELGKQTYGAQDGGEEYLRELLEMETFVKGILTRNT